MEIERPFSLIEPEEILFDVHNPAGFLLERHEGKIETRASGFIVVRAVIIFLISLVVLGVRTGYLTLAKGQEFFLIAENNRIDLIVSPAPRGEILDRYGKELAGSRPGFSVVVNKDFLPMDEIERTDVLQKVSQLLTIPFEEVSNSISSSPSRFILLESNVDHDKALVIQNRIDVLPGVLVEAQSVRSYTFPKELSHVIGFMGKPSAEDLTLFPQLSTIEVVGKWGLERLYETSLHGVSGKKLIEVNAIGKPQHEVLTTKSEAGHQLVLEIDSDLQKHLYESLERSRQVHKATGASGIIIEAKTGAILAQVSLPSFDASLFLQPQAYTKIRELLNDETKPLFNRTLQGLYPPGSTIMPFLALSALEEQIIYPEKKVSTPLAIFVPNEYNPSIIYRFPDWRDHGYLNMAEALAWSSNVYFFTIGGGYQGVKG